jgi:beta-alanine degradation protein BauB
MKAHHLTIGILAVSVALLASAQITKAQDPVKADPQHFKVMLENEQVRVLQGHYGPHEKSAMHEVAGGVVVFVTGQHAKITFADGKVRENNAKPGEVRWTAVGKHQVENLSDRPFTIIVVELKAKGPKSD